MQKQVFMDACRQGGRQVDSAVAALYRHYGRALWREAWLHLRDGDAAQDLLQDTFLRAWNACASFRGESELFPWLVTILRRRAIDLLRARRPDEPLTTPEGAVRDDVEQALQREHGTATARPEGLLMQRQADAVFHRCLQRFADDHPQAAQVIRWVAEDGLSSQDIAALLQRSPGATREFISQCRKKARLYFADWYQLQAHEGQA